MLASVLTGSYLDPESLFRSTEKPGCIGDGRAESTWTTIANGLNVHAVIWARETKVGLSTSRGNDHCIRTQ